MATWKARERAVAAALGGKRAPNDGLPHSDVIGVPWSVEVKASRRVFSRGETQARAQAKLEKKPWLLVICRHNRKLDDATISTTFGEWLRLARKAGEVPELPETASASLEELEQSLVIDSARTRTEAT